MLPAFADWDVKLARTDHDAGGQKQHRQGQQHLHAPLTKEKLHALHFCLHLCLTRAPEPIFGTSCVPPALARVPLLSRPRSGSDARPGTLADRFRLVLPLLPCPPAALWPWDKCLAVTG